MQARVDCGALVEGANGRVRIDDVGIVALAAEQSQYIAVLFCKRLRGLHVVSDPGETLEIFPDIGARLLALDAELVRQSKGRDAIDDAKIDRLSPAAHFGRHAFDGHPEHLRGGHGVDIEVLAECLSERLDRRNLSEQPQLDLRIVG